MKKYFYSVLAAGMLCATSCSQDQEIVDITKGEGQQVTFKVQIPEANESRAINVDRKDVTIGDGTLATRLIYAQFEAGTTTNSTVEPLVVGIVDDADDGNTDKSFTVSLTMAKDLTYDFLFMAYNPENNIFGIPENLTSSSTKEAIIADVDLRNLQLKRNAENHIDLQANQEAYDAFVGKLENRGINNEVRTVSLKRPFAQVNAVATQADLDAAKQLGITVTHSQLKIDAPTAYNIYSGKAGTQDPNVDVEEITYQIADIFKKSPNVTEGHKNETFDNTNDQYYLTSVYVLTDATETSSSSINNAVFTFYRGNTENDCVSTINIPSLPLQRNYRTNVIGNLITKTEDYTIEIKPGFDGLINKWDGILPESIALDENSTFVIKSVEADHGVKLSGKGTLILDGVTINAETGSAITLEEGANVTLQIRNSVSLTGATNGIDVPAGAHLTITGATGNRAVTGATGNLVVVGTAGSGIGMKGANTGTITIDELAHITAKGNGDHAFGIGGNEAAVVIKNSTVDYACGGHIQPLFVNDTKYGKSEPEGGAGIGGANIKIEGSTITNVDGGSKAAAIGAQYWQSTNIVIKKSTINEANGGNASAGIGGSRYASDSKYNVSIKIEESTITATGGQGGAGIGSGYDTHCNGQDYEATNEIVIDGASVINAKGGKYAAGIGTGFHSAYLSGSIAEGATINAESGENFYKDTYSTAQNIGYGVVDPAREFSGKNSIVTFKVNGQLIEIPVEVPVAKIGNTEYKSIDEAIANWANNTTLTLLRDVTLSDVITLKSTEHHILDLGTYTLTAKEDKDAFVIKACGTGDAERTAITIKADANNPGGINAGNKCIVYYKYADGGISGNDRPIIKIEGGVFVGSTSLLGTAGIYTIGKEARKCATLNISGGTFNCSINGSSKSKLLISGGVFHYSVGSQGDSTALRLISGGRFKTLGFMTADSNNTKFWFGTSMANSNVGLYIDDENYLVVGGPVITEFGEKFAAKATNPTKWSSYLKYSSAAEHGLYYTNAAAAIAKHGEANVELK